MSMQSLNFQCGMKCLCSKSFGIPVLLYYYMFIRDIGYRGTQVKLLLLPLAQSLISDTAVKLVLYFEIDFRFVLIL